MIDHTTIIFYVTEGSPETDYQQIEKSQVPLDIADSESSEAIDDYHKSIQLSVADVERSYTPPSEDRGSPEGASLPDSDNLTASISSQKGDRKCINKPLSLCRQNESGDFMTKSLPVFPTTFDDFQSLEKLNLSIMSLEQQIDAAGNGDDDSFHQALDTTSVRSTCLLSAKDAGPSSSCDDLSASSYVTPNMHFVEEEDALINLESAADMKADIGAQLLVSGEETGEYTEADENEEDVWECGEVDSMTSGQHENIDQLDSNPHEQHIENGCFVLRAGTAEEQATGLPPQVELSPTTSEKHLPSTISGPTSDSGVVPLSSHDTTHVIDNACSMDTECPVSTTEAYSLEPVEEDLMIVQKEQLLNFEPLEMAEYHVSTPACQEQVLYAQCLETETELTDVSSLEPKQAIRKYVSIKEKRLQPSDIYVQKKCTSNTPIENLTEVSFEMGDIFLGIAYASVDIAKKVRFGDAQKFEVDVFNCGELWKEGEICDGYIALHQAERLDLYRRARELPQHPRTRYDHTQVFRSEVFYAGMEGEVLPAAPAEPLFVTVRYADIREVITKIPDNVTVKYFQADSVCRICSEKAAVSRTYHKPICNWPYKHQVKTYDAKSLPDRRQEKKHSNPSRKEELLRHNRETETITAKDDGAKQQKLSRVEAIKEKVKANFQQKTTEQDLSQTQAKKTANVSKAPQQQLYVKHKLARQPSNENKQTSFHKFDAADKIEEPSNKEKERQEKKQAKLRKIEQEVQKQAEERELARQKAAEMRRVQNEQREAQKSALRIEAQKKLKEKFEASARNLVTEPKQKTQKKTDKSASAAQQEQSMKKRQEREEKKKVYLSSIDKQLEEESKQKQLERQLSAEQRTLSVERRDLSAERRSQKTVATEPDLPSTFRQSLQANNNELSNFSTQPTSNDKVQDYLANNQLQKSMMVAHSAPDLRLSKANIDKHKHDSRTKLLESVDTIHSSDDDSSLADSLSLASDTPYDSDSSSTSSHLRSSMYRFVLVQIMNVL